MITIKVQIISKNLKSKVCYMLTSAHFSIFCTEGNF